MNYAKLVLWYAPFFLAHYAKKCVLFSIVSRNHQWFLDNARNNYYNSREMFLTLKNINTNIIYAFTKKTKKVNTDTNKNIVLVRTLFEKVSRFILEIYKNIYESWHFTKQNNPTTQQQTPTSGTTCIEKTRSTWTDLR